MSSSENCKPNINPISQQSIDPTIVASIGDQIALAVKEKINKIDQNKPTFSDVLQNMTHHNTLPQSNSPPPNNTKTILINTKDPAKVSTKALQQMIKTKFNNHTHKIKIKKTFPTQKGLGLIIPAQSKSMDDIIQSIKRDVDPKDSICNLYQPKPRLPTLLMKGVSKDIEIDEFKSNLCDLNDIDPSGITNYFPLKGNRNSPTVDNVIRTTPETFQLIESKNFELFIGNQVCRLRRRVLVDQCQTCFGFGHSKANCNKQNAHPICSHCGVQDENHNCDKAQPMSCYNCHKHNFFSTKPHNHRPNHIDCPLYKRRHDQIESQTVYYPNSSN